MTNKLKHAFAICVVLVLSALAKAQTRVNTTSSVDLRNGYEFRLNSFPLERTTKRSFSQVGFSLAPEAIAKVNATVMTPMAAGLNLQVVGGGLLPHVKILMKCDSLPHEEILTKYLRAMTP